MDFDWPKYWWIHRIRPYEKYSPWLTSFLEFWGREYYARPHETRMNDFMSISSRVYILDDFPKFG